MFQSLSDRLSQSLRGISGKARLSDENIRRPCGRCVWPCWEADVALPVVKDFVEGHQAARLGQEVMKSLESGQAFLRASSRPSSRQVMGPPTRGWTWPPSPGRHPHGGLRGAGKTTTVAKLAKLLKERAGKR